MSNILVTGGCGYIGSRLVEELLNKQENKVVVLDSGIFGFDSLSEFLYSERFKLVKGDIRIKEDILKSLNQIDTIIHLASLVGEPSCVVDKDIAYDINVRGTRNLVECAVKKGVKNFIFASSCSVYGFGKDKFDEHSIPNPVDYYAELKLLSEKDLLNYKDKLNIIILRFCTVFGLSRRMRFDLAVNVMTASALNNGVINVYGGQQERPFIHCGDVARAINLLFEERCKNKYTDNGIEVFNVGNNSENYNLTEVASIISKATGNTKVNLDGLKEDNRSYSVSFDKIEQLGFSSQKSIEVGVEEIANSMKSGLINNPFCDIYSNVKVATKEYLN